MVSPLRVIASAWSLPEPAPPDTTEQPRWTELPSRAPHLRLVPQVRQVHPLLAQRDPGFIRRIFPRLSWFTDRYFRSEVDGVEHLSERASLIVSTHNGGIFMPDLLSLSVAFWRRFGIETPGHGLFHALGMKVPGYGRVAIKLGALPASRHNARLALEADRPILLCPGGDADNLKPFSKRHQITFGQRRGFIRLAIQQQVPIIPSVSVGAHEVFFVLNDGRRLAERTGVARLLRLKTIPLTLSFPFGLTPGGVGALPLPSKVRVQVLPKIELGESPSAADDPEVVERCFEHVRSTMQRALDQLASKRRWPVLG